MSKKQERQTKEVEKCKQAIDRETEIERQRDSDREKRSAVPQKRHVKKQVKAKMTSVHAI